MVVLKPARLHAQQKKMGKKNNIVEPPIRGPKTMAIISPNSFETQKVGKPKQKIARKKTGCMKLSWTTSMIPPLPKKTTKFFGRINQFFWVSDDTSIILHEGFLGWQTPDTLGLGRLGGSLEAPWSEVG